MICVRELPRGGFDFFFPSFLAGVFLFLLLPSGSHFMNAAFQGEVWSEERVVMASATRTDIIVMLLFSDEKVIMVVEKRRSVEGWCIVIINGSSK